MLTKPVPWDKPDRPNVLELLLPTALRGVECFFCYELLQVTPRWKRWNYELSCQHTQNFVFSSLIYIKSSPRIWKGLSATLQSGRYTLSYPKGRNNLHFFDNKWYYCSLAAGTPVHEYPFVITVTAIAWNQNVMLKDSDNICWGNVPVSIKARTWCVPRGGMHVLLKNNVCSRDTWFPAFTVTVTQVLVCGIICFSRCSDF